MIARVNQDECIGCGACAGTAPDVFRLGEDGKSEVYVDAIKDEWEDDVRAAADGCPMGAISIE